MGWSAFRKTGLRFHNPNLSVKGYTLFTPMMGDSVYLIDMAGLVVKQWRFDDFIPDHAKLLASGNLLVSGKTKADAQRQVELKEEDYPHNLDLHFFRLGGGYSELREYSPKGELTWSFREIGIHHDFIIKDNGNLLIPQWVILPADIARKVKGGIKEKQAMPMLADDIIEINRQGEILERFSTWQYLDPVKDPIQPLETRWEWTHLNSVDVQGDALLVSCRDNSRVFAFDTKTSELLFKVTEPMVSMQHHATFLGNGNIQIFDNGMNKPLSIPFSRIIEFDPVKNDLVWEYKGEPSEQFFSGHISGAQRLAMANVLICEGSSGRLFEVTRNKTIVWEYINPFVGANADGRIYSWVYRAYRYEQSFAGLGYFDLNAGQYKALNSNVL